MIEISRRWFLLGSAAAVAAASISIPVDVTKADVVRLPAGHVYKRRHISGITIANEQEPMELSLILREQQLWGTRTPAGAYYRWIATPERELVMLPRDVLRLVATGGRQSMVELTCHDYVDDGPPISLIEIYPHPFAKPQVYFFEADNSLEARLLRRERANQQLQHWGDDLDDD